MNKIIKALTCALLGGTMMFTVACHPNSGNPGDGSGNGDKTQIHDPESRAFALSIGALDENFNPFFYTSQNDGQVISLTQVPLLTVGKDGKPYMGEDYPTVAKDHKITYYDSTGKVTEDSEKAANGGRTEYEFLIKNGMKYSDGEPLTIKDVLFNFYVYLDTAYTGSNTMYSVDIQGLKAYQENDSRLLTQDADNSATYAAGAQARIQKLVDYCNNENGGLNGDTFKADTQAQEDLALIQSLFKDELNSDWTNVETSWKDSYGDDYSFNNAWEAYLLYESIVKVQRRSRGAGGGSYEIRVDENNNEISPDNKDEYEKGKKLTTLDPWREGALDSGNKAGIRELQYIIDGIADATTPELIADYIRDNQVNLDSTEENEAYAYLQLSKKYCIDYMYTAKMDSSTGIIEVITQWGTAQTAYSAFYADERSKAITNSQYPVYSIQGIQTDKVTSFNGQDLNAEHDVLRIVINDVDPAAIWQFGISIAPLHYYSGTYEGKDYIASFNGDQNNGKGPGDESTCFGVKRSDWNFFNNVVKGVETSKSALPVGAGAYKASTVSGGSANSGGQFFNNNIVYFERNTQFNTMGGELENAKIKYLRYKVIEESRIVTSIENKQIDYGEPNATDTNYTAVLQNKELLGDFRFDTNGYGYVGINPTYVPDINIRRIIMRAMNPADCLEYYGDLAKNLFRPMSRTSWAYPQDATTYPGYEVFTSSTQIEAELTKLGYKKVNGIYQDKFGKPCTYTFTIAGASSDHPAYNMFLSAERLLDGAGFDISVSTDSTALKKLTLGQLAVWAAAWSTGVDPDMYQVYHKDSQATSVLNWGYRTILNDQTKYPTEYNYIIYLSSLIDQARSTLDQDTRIELYSQCLNTIMDLSVELPIYQRQDLCVFNKQVLDVTTMNESPTANIGVLDKIWLVNYL